MREELRGNVELSQANHVTCREKDQFIKNLPYLELHVPVEEEPASNRIPHQLPVLGPVDEAAVLQPALHHTNSPLTCTQHLDYTTKISKG